MGKKNRYSFKKFQKENERKEKAKKKMEKRQGREDEPTGAEDESSMDRLGSDSPLDSSVPEIEPGG